VDLIERQMVQTIMLGRCIERSSAESGVPIYKVRSGCVPDIKTNWTFKAWQESGCDGKPCSGDASQWFANGIAAQTAMFEAQMRGRAGGGGVN
jgi:hypothetical protein